jgi:hypothetical protein
MSGARAKQHTLVVKSGRVKPGRVIGMRAYGRCMTTSGNSDTPDGSSHPTEEQKKHTENLADGSPSGDATKDPGKDSDTTSGGEPE